MANTDTGNQTAFELLKLDLGLKNTAKDQYFRALVAARQKELEEKGITLDPENVEDAMLIADYAAWTYRSRQEDTPLPMNLQLRIRNRIVARRANHGKNVL